MRVNENRETLGTNRFRLLCKTVVNGPRTKYVFKPGSKRSYVGVRIGRGVYFARGSRARVKTGVFFQPVKRA